MKIGNFLQGFEPKNVSTEKEPNLHQVLYFGSHSASCCKAEKLTLFVNKSRVCCFVDLACNLILGTLEVCSHRIEEEN